MEDNARMHECMKEIKTLWEYMNNNMGKTDDKGINKI